MIGRMGRRVLIGLLGMVASWAILARAGAFGTTDPPDVSTPPDAPDPSAFAFFEREVRPILVERCQGCHGSKKSKADLRLDSRSALLDGGQSGPAIVPGNPGESLLIDAINYGELHQMPPKSKLPDREIAALTRWVEMGAPWPSPLSEPGRTGSAPKATPFDLRERARHWSFRPIRKQGLPGVTAGNWPRSPIDRFILSALEARGLSPAPEADRRTLIRRVTFDLTGLPPTPSEIAAFLADDSPGAYEKVVERLLASPRYGERWARHWLDLVGFAETAGHEFDYEILDAYRYRDYVIRAFNSDLAYDRFVVEQIAGDLLEPPRRHPVEGFNESTLGTGLYRLGEGTHSPVDLRDDEAMRVDRQIDVLAKTFLGLTVSCARCHDHKFDPISTKDYYALVGYLHSSRHQHAFIDPPERIAAKAAELRALKGSLRSLIEASGHAPGGFDQDREDPAPEEASIVFETFDGPTYEGWSVAGDAFGDGPTRAGDWLIRDDGETSHAASVAPGVAHSGLVAERFQGVLRSRTFVIEKRYIHTLAAGRQGRINLVIDGFEKIRGPIYDGLTIAVNSERPRWHTQDVGMWLGHRAYLEIADGATVDFTHGQSAYSPGIGFIAVDEIRFADEKPSGRSGRAITRDAVDLGRCAQACACHPWDEALIRYRAIASQIPAPNLSPAIVDGDGVDARVHLRGSTRNLGDVVPRRFLEAIAGGDQPAPSRGSGRLELARRLVDPSNPLPARVLVNRVWKHHFGEGIVRTPDDFGVMGQAPTHPELLDDLAARFIDGGWSIKALQRLLVLSSTYRMRSEPTPGSERLDPDNRWLHRMNVRRLEAEAIRDALLAVSGRLDRTLYGPSVAPYLTSFMDGRGRPSASGPLDGDGRRSLYLNVRRNFLNPMFLAFDFPVPSSPMGRRNVSNVPAQALTLLNDPFVNTQARLWADRLEAEDGPGRSPRGRIARLYEQAFGRPPNVEEVAAGLAFLGEQANTYGRPDDPRAWADLCHVLINVKEFIYIP